MAAISCPVDLGARAKRALIEAGFTPDFPPGTNEELAEIRRRGPFEGPPLKDLSHLPWSSIDNEESRDLDQVECAIAEGNSIRLMIGVADVASFVRKDGPIDTRAARNTVTIYTGAVTFNMLPHELSTGNTSLLPGQPRRVVVIEMLVDEDGEVRDQQIYPARIINHARLTYGQAGDILEGQTPATPVSDVFLEQLHLQNTVARRLSRLRQRMGALTFSSFEPRIVAKNGKVLDLKVVRHTRARDLIESFMIAANVAAATFLKSNGFPIIERVVEAPKRWDRIRDIAATYGFKLPPEPEPKILSEFLAARRAASPETFQDLSLSIVKLLGSGSYRVEYPDGPQKGHFGLALDDYSHTTAPNRRFADLVLQRLLFALLAQRKLPYSPKELKSIADHCTEREDAARKVERRVRKIAAGHVMIPRIGEVFRGRVTGASPKGTWVRLLDPPVEGKIIRGDRGIDVGDVIDVRLRAVDPDRGFIDFDRVLPGDLKE